jgi:hypothetical protein
MSQAPCYIRCGAPGCKCQIALIDLDESETERLRESFREHCIESQPRRYRLRSVVRPQEPHHYPDEEMSLLQKASSRPASEFRAIEPDE